MRCARRRRRRPHRIVGVDRVAARLSVRRSRTARHVLAVGGAVRIVYRRMPRTTCRTIGTRSLDITSDNSLRASSSDGAETNGTSSGIERSASSSRCPYGTGPRPTAWILTSAGTAGLPGDKWTPLRTAAPRYSDMLTVQPDATTTQVVFELGRGNAAILAEGGAHHQAFSPVARAVARPTAQGGAPGRFIGAPALPADVERLHDERDRSAARPRPGSRSCRRSTPRASAATLTFARRCAATGTISGAPRCRPRTQRDPGRRAAGGRGRRSGRRRPCGPRGRPRRRQRSQAWAWRALRGVAVDERRAAAQDGALDGDRYVVHGGHERSRTLLIEPGTRSSDRQPVARRDRGRPEVTGAPKRRD